MGPPKSGGATLMPGLGIGCHGLPQLNNLNNPAHFTPSVPTVDD